MPPTQQNCCCLIWRSEILAFDHDFATKKAVDAAGTREHPLRNFAASSAAQTVTGSVTGSPCARCFPTQISDRCSVHSCSWLEGQLEGQTSTSLQGGRCSRGTLSRGTLLTRWTKSGDIKVKGFLRLDFLAGGRNRGRNRGRIFTFDSRQRSSIPTPSPLPLCGRENDFCRLSHLSATAA